VKDAPEQQESNDEHDGIALEILDGVWHIDFHAARVHGARVACLL
jgi:hypothetical protein